MYMNTTRFPTRKKKPKGCYNCIHFKWVDNPNKAEGELLLIPKCFAGYDGIMENWFRINQSKARNPNGNKHPQITSSPSCMETEDDLLD